MTHTPSGPELRWLVVGVALFAATQARAATYFAGPEGCSDSGEGSATSPFCTLKHAVSKLKPGDTLFLRSGTFKEQLSISLVASAASPIVIQADEDATPVIEGQGLPLKDTGLVLLAGAKHVQLRGVVVQNATADCVRVSGADNVTLDRVQATGCEHGGIVAFKSTNLKLTGCEISNTGTCTGACTNEALTLSGVSDFVVSGAFIHGGTRDGIALRDGARNGKVHSSVVQEVGVGVNLIQASNIDLYDNDLHTNRQSGIALTNGPTGVPLANRNQIYRNLSWNNAGHGLRFWVQQATGEMRENKVYNNDFVGNTQAGIQLDENTSVVKDNILRNNIFMSNAAGSIAGAARAANTISHCLFAPPQASVGTSAVSGDPLFASAAFGNFHLSAGSPAIDKGFDMGLATVGPPDIGAFEYGQATIADASTQDAAGPSSTEPDRGCGCSSGPRVGELAARGTLLVLLALLLGLWRRRREGRR